MNKGSTVTNNVLRARGVSACKVVFIRRTTWLWTKNFHWKEYKMDISNTLNYCIEKMLDNVRNFGSLYPNAQSAGYVYGLQDNTQDWTNGFYTGLLWLCYELTGNVEFKQKAQEHTQDFQKRYDARAGLNTHDIGFLYSLSAVADYKVTKNEEAKKLAVGAADLLCERYKPKGGFIQAWGDLDDDESCRLIIDCLLNIPLLFWAYEATGDAKYDIIARTHLYTTLNVIIRDDFTTHHTFYFDPETGKPLKGVQHQGYSDSSCWARGQAWGICGTAYAYSYTKDSYLIEVFKNLLNCYTTRLPDDFIPYWDMIFTSGDEPRDTSAAAIALCGMLHMRKHTGLHEFDELIDKTLKSLCENYTTKDKQASNGLLTDGMYARTRNDNPECNIWGDYFFLEALMRLKNDAWAEYF